jgi:hypothetical protein
MKFTAEQEARMDHVTRRFLLGKQLKALVHEVIASDMTSDDIQDIFGAAGISLHPVFVQIILARRAQQV